MGISITAQRKQEEAARTQDLGAQTAPAAVMRGRRLTQDEQDAMIERLAKPLPPATEPPEPVSIRKYALENGKVRSYLAPVPVLGRKEYDTKMSDMYATQVESKKKSYLKLVETYYTPLVKKAERPKSHIAAVSQALYEGKSAKEAAA